MDFLTFCELCVNREIWKSGKGSWIFHVTLFPLFSSFLHISLVLSSFAEVKTSHDEASHSLSGGGSTHDEVELRISAKLQSQGPGFSQVNMNEKLMLASWEGHGKGVTPLGTHELMSLDASRR